jgi:signal recognition particle receptor subunit beta
VERYRNMAWHDEDSWLTQALSPKPATILITLAIAIFLPILLHSWLYRKAASSTGLPTFLLVGPSGGGKTAFTTLVCCWLSLQCARIVGA